MVIVLTLSSRIIASSDITLITTTMIMIIMIIISSISLMIDHFRACQCNQFNNCLCFWHCNPYCSVISYFWSYCGYHMVIVLTLSSRIITSSDITLITTTMIMIIMIIISSISLMIDHFRACQCNQFNKSLSFNEHCDRFLYYQTVSNTNPNISVVSDWTTAKLCIFADATSIISETRGTCSTLMPCQFRPHIDHQDHKWKPFLRYWSFVRGIHRSQMNSHQKGQWRRALMLSLICAWTNGWVNNRDDSDLRRHRAHGDVNIMLCLKSIDLPSPIF